MKKRGIWLVSALALVLFLPPAVRGEVDWRVERTIPLSGVPKQTVLSQDGRWLFLLLEQGIVEVLDAAGSLQGRIPVGPDANSISLSPDTRRLFVQRVGKNTLEQIRIDFVQSFAEAGSPTRGSPDAPVPIVVFSDFQ